MPNYNNGSFKINVSVVNNPPNDLNFLDSTDLPVHSVEKMINPLTQNELAEGWEQVVPSPRSKVYFITKNGSNFRRTKKLKHYFKIDLSKLPENLWDKLKPVYEEGLFSYSIVQNKIFVYIVNPSVVDNEIRELYCLINQQHFNKEKAMKLLQVLEDNNIHGWVVIRAKNLIGNKVQVL